MVVGPVAPGAPPNPHPDSSKPNEPVTVAAGAAAGTAVLWVEPSPVEATSCGVCQPPLPAAPAEPLVCAGDLAAPPATPHYAQPACPPRLEAADLSPHFRPYPFPTTIFHCGYDVRVERRTANEPPISREHPQQECAYDEKGQLVTEDHPYAGCRGTPNDCASDVEPVCHVTIDRGGVARAGVPALVETIRHALQPSMLHLDGYLTEMKYRMTAGLAYFDR